MADRLFIFDTTLRDGEQSPGATMNLQEKLRMARQLEMLGVDVIEAGFPATSEGDFEAVKAIAGVVCESGVAALCRANSKDIARAWAALREAVKPRLHIVIAASDLHMQHKLNLTREEVVERAVASVRQAVDLCADVEFSAEDASRADPAFLIRLFGEAIAAGARTINLADTVGYAQPEEFGALIRAVREQTPGGHKVVFGVHCHDDLGLGVANTLAGIRAGARQVDVTLGGIGERAGNAALEEVVMALATRQDVYGVTTGINTTQLYPSCRLLSMITGMPIPANKAIVGGNAFSHESGIHQDGVLKHRATYEIMTPASIGRGESELVIGKHSGRHAVKARLEQLGYRLEKSQVQAVFDAVKQLADKKAVIQDEDLEALVLSHVYRLPDRYKLLDITVQTSSGNLPAVAAVSLEVSGQVMRRAGFGSGPIDAAYNVISQIVGRATELERFSINAITGGTDALGEVTVRLREDARVAVGHGSDSDIIIACAKSFVDALNRLDKKARDEGQREPAPE